MVQDFYTQMSDKAFKYGPTSTEFSGFGFLEHIESFISVRAYGVLFCTRLVEWIFLIFQILQI
jgi:hypothetical protein